MSKNNYDIALGIFEQGLDDTVFNINEVAGKRLPRKRLTRILEILKLAYIVESALGDDIYKLPKAYNTYHRIQDTFFHHGNDYGVPLKVVYEKGDHLFVIGKAHTGWHGVGSTVPYAPTYMVVKLLGKDSEGSKLFDIVVADNALYGGEITRKEWALKRFLYKVYVNRHGSVENEQ